MTSRVHEGLLVNQTRRYLAAPGYPLTILAA